MIDPLVTAGKYRASVETALVVSIRLCQASAGTLQAASQRNPPKPRPI